MIKLTTPVPVREFKNQIDYSSRIVLLGSCFTENIGTQLDHHGFHTTINPFGILFNPVSIAILVFKAANDIAFEPEDVEDTFSYFAHSDLNGEDKTATLIKLNAARSALKKALMESSHIFITLGSAWVYRHNERKMIVANCHKQPQDYFKKELLSPQEIADSLTSIVNEIKKLHLKSEVIFTLSPVRHLKDGAVENTRSKSRLHDAIQHVVDLQKAVYFPSYEIVMDEMRDYRFYGKDLLHLNELGVEYVWSRFRESVINKNTLTLQEKVKKYRNLAAHRPKDLIKHKEQVEAMRNNLLTSYPELHL